MGAKYYMGTRKGKAKSSGNDYWAVLLFRLNRFKSYEVSQCFVDEETYNRVNQLGLALGVAVTVSGDLLDGQIDDIQVDTSYVPLNLNQKSSPSPVYVNNKGK